MSKQVRAAGLRSFTLMDFQWNVGLVLVIVVSISTTLPVWLSPASSCPVSLSVHTHTHWGYWRTGSTSVYMSALGAVDVGIWNKGCLSLSCLSSCPPAGVFTSAKESCEAEMEVRLCDGVVLAVCACLSGKGVAAWCDTLDYPGWLGIIFGFPMAPSSNWNSMLCFLL